MHPKRHLPRKRTMIFPYLVIAPAIILILIFKLYPIVLNIWSSFQGNDGLMMFLLAGIKDIDETVYESAKIDGASYWQSVFHIMLPMLKRTMAFVVINDTTSNLLLFAPMYMITKGGPQNSTNVLMYEVYKSAFIYGDSARAAASMSVLLLIVGIIVAVQFKFLNKEE